MSEWGTWNSQAYAAHEHAPSSYGSWSVNSGWYSESIDESGISASSTSWSRQDSYRNSTAGDDSQRFSTRTSPQPSSLTWTPGSTGIVSGKGAAKGKGKEGKRSQTCFVCGKSREQHEDGRFCPVEKGKGCGKFCFQCGKPREEHEGGRFCQDPNKLGEKGGKGGESRAGNIHSQLNEEIIGCKDIADLLHLCSFKLCQFDFVNTVTALHRIAKTPDSRNLKYDDRVASVVTNIRKFLDNEVLFKRPRHVANASWAFAKLLVQDEDLLHGLAAAVMDNISSYEPQSISSIAWAMATNHVENEPLLAAISGQALLRMTEFDPRGLSNIAWACANIRAADQTLLMAVASQASSNIAVFDEQGLSTTFWSFAKLGYNDDNLFDALTSEALCRVSSLHPQGLANIVWSLAKLQVKHIALLKAISLQSLSRIKDMQAQHMTNTVWALVKLEWVDETLMVEVGKHSLAFINQCAPQNLGNLAWAFAKLAMQDARLMEAISHASIAKITACRHQEIGNISWAYAVLALRDAPLFLAIAIETQATLNQFNVQGIANTAWAFAKLSITNEPFMASISKPVLVNISAWDPQALANIAWAHATLLINDDAVLNALSLQATRTITEFATQNLSNLIWAYATLKVVDGSAFGQQGRAEDPTLCGFSGGDDAQPNFSAEEITEALGKQGFECISVSAVTTPDGELDVDRTVAEAFSPGLPSSGVLVLADGQYLACTRHDSLADGKPGLMVRNVVRGTDRRITVPDFAKHILHDQCFRVQPIAS